MSGIDVIPVWNARNIQTAGEECRVAPERGSKKRNASLHVLASFAQRTIIVVLVSVVAIVAVIIVAIQAVYLTEDV